jgi:dipicolinate synthase subunit A
LHYYSALEVFNVANHRNFAIIGGDLRQIRLANALAEEGYSVCVYGFDPDAPYLTLIPKNSLEEALDGANIVILPLPAVADSGYVSTPYYKGKIEVNTLLERMNKNQILLGGKIDDALKTLIDVHNVYAIDYFMREELTVLNAIPTAEGAISIALNETATTLCGSKCLVIGFGRIGKVLCKMLDGIGAKVCAAARKYEAFAWIDAYGYDKCHTDALETVIHQYDIIFNTVPHKVLGKKVLKNMRDDTLIIDLASKPGGVDLNAAKEYGVKTVWALSLPGRVAPISAGDIIKQTVLNICAELGV